ncbi:hypothetical protein EMPG_11144 [Blastomyces silverae]|uniref:C2H2-type domain-containing protein n=1 Tax=Blastomyces silverae TaxID=2060906 RepID=A0A0H1B312_9EURO|nr:hypothetical protein EMPG_11144 [Blastomyces silverae]
MSAATSSPRSIENQSPNLSAFKAQSYSDPFLPNPSNSDEQLPLGPHSDLATVNLSELENQHPNAELPGEGFNNRSFPVSPNNLYLPGGSEGGPTHTRPNTNPQSNVHSPTSNQDFLSPSDYAENGYSDFSSLGSPETDNPFFLEPEFGIHPELEPLTLPISEVHEHRIPQEPTGLNNEQNLETTTLTASQLLSPGLTNTPSPPSDGHNIHLASMSGGRDKLHRPSRMDIPAHRFQQTPTLTTTSPCSDTLEVNNFSHSDRPTSPIVKVSSYTRGDSPARNYGLTDRRSDRRGRPTLSSSHLAPTDNKHEYEYDDTDDSHYVGSHYRSISVPPLSLRAEDGSWVANSSTGASGLDPASRGDIYVPSPKEMIEQQKREQKNADVEQWLSVSEVKSDVEDNGASGRKPRRRNKLVTLRRRAKSTGDPVATHQQFFDDSKIPGPGVLIDEDSGLEDIEDDNDSDVSSKLPETPPAKVNLDSRDEPPEGGYFPPVTNDDENQNTEPLPRQFIRPRPWQDPFRNPHIGDTRDQPTSSNAAMARFGRAAENIETASRAATWGTTRRMSESDIRSLHASNGSFNPSGVDKEKKHTRRNSIFKHTNKLLPKRSNSSAKRKLAESAQQQSSTESVDKPKSKDTREGGLGSSALPQRKPSFTRSPRSPSTTGGAVWAMTGQIAAVGGGGPVAVSSPNSSSSPWKNNFIMRRSRSKSDLPKISKSPGSGGLLELITNFGGPPVPTLASPLQDKALAPSPLSGRGLNDDDEDEDDEDEQMGDKGVTMDFTVRADPIVPTLEGFKTQIQQLNPRLKSPALIERFAQEQLRRYKRLIDLKLQHVQAVKMQNCTSGKHCFEQGGEATMLPPRISSKDPDSTYAQFQVTTSADPDEDMSGFGEGTVTAALFPHGVPLPPVKRLPAQFECSLCFKVKAFQKPSDWTKHVHEDVMPFTCTFPNCTEPKSFKRKADWVRHESERHRQLEWWACNMQDCSHRCYRKDNFVQHLVREHKMPEPKAKSSRVRGSGNNKGAAKKTDNQQSSAHDQGVDQVWKLVEECHHNNPKKPQDEACRFCGNICNSWKKLSVHMAKHMEQIAMPVLSLVKQRTICADTLISPIEIGSYPPLPKVGNGQSPAMSPLPGTTPYQNSFQSDQATNANLGHSTFGTSTAQNAESYTATQSPSLADHLQMHAVQNELTAVSLGMGGRSISAGGQSYNLSPYSQSASPSVSEQQSVYPVTTRASQQFNSHHASATYPPPYNAMSRRLELPISDIAQSPVGATAYDLTAAAAVSNTTAYDTQQHIYTSPVENAGYVYQQSQGGMRPSGALHYNNVTAPVQYPVVSGPNGGPAGQVESYGQHRDDPYQYQNQG